MPNKNYLAGRRFEYERSKWWRSCGHDVLRTAGSHGLFDLISISRSGDLQFIQCKRVSTEAEANRMVAAFKTNPPLGHRERSRYHQVLEVKVKGSTTIHTARI